MRRAIGVKIPKSKGCAVMRRTNDANEESVVGNGVCAEELAAVDLRVAIEPCNAGPDSATCGRICVKPGCARPHCIDDLAIARAAAEYATQRVGNFRFIGMRIPLQKSGCRNQHSRRAYATLRGAMVQKRLSQRPAMRRVLGESLNG